ncbi:PREDICTED: UDP-glucuronosyltransferase 2B2-like [Papilio xuthus]|uniref:UDP-glucuronosyltransferase n=1 Tax=Papilio xuthus TaxID=66420 RepID=A0AAJ7EDI4_PAPXU|nr:PREDICTED: UDP-glucuronosyltransferase 2B2-like [Papilio xuthus]
MNLVLTFLIIVIVNSASCLNILGIFPYQGKSHFFVHRVYLRELAKRGHNVTIISHFPEKVPPKNYHDISLAGSIKILEDDMPVHRSYMTVLQVGVFLTTSGKENCEVMLANKDVQNMIKQKPKYDVVVVEVFNSDCALGIAYKLNAPVVGITSHILMPWHYSRLGIPYNPSYVSFHFLEGGTKPTFVQRLERVIFDTYFKTLYYFVSQRNDQNTLARYFDDIPPLEDLAREMKFLLLYHNFILTGSKLFPANVIEVGGYHVQESKLLTGDLKKFFDAAEHGVIYISFGSVIKSSTMPRDKLEAVLGAVKELPQRFVWKWEDKTLLVDKNKLYLADWLPQVDILGHPKTVAFLSHGGMGGTTEAIHFGVPVVAMPVFGDQPSNAAAVEESGLGVQLQVRDLTKENLIAAFKKVLDPKFRSNVKLLSKAWHDRPMAPLDTAIYWTEFAARYSNFTYRTAAADVPLYQYLNLDIVLVFTALLILLLATLKAIVSLCCGSKRKEVPSKKVKRKKN